MSEDREKLGFVWERSRGTGDVYRMEVPLPEPPSEQRAGVTVVRLPKTLAVTVKTRLGGKALVELRLADEVFNIVLATGEIDDQTTLDLLHGAAEMADIKVIRPAEISGRKTNPPRRLEADEERWEP